VSLPLVQDAFGRALRDLRISVTDRCNFRCTYCMPKEVFGEDHPFLPRAQLLTFEELERLSRVFVRLGVRKLRLTGGEPLLRRGIEDLVGMLARVDEVEDVTLTTNGSALAEKAEALAKAGLRRVTVSLDSLEEATFSRVNDVGFPVARVLEGIAAAERAGLSPIKVNMVVIRGRNDHDVVPMARRFRGTGHVLRYIEYMDVGASNGWRMDDVVPAAEIRDRVSREWPLEALPPEVPGEVATRWRYADGAGEVGFIASVTRPFCRGCVRARLSADGKLFTCLFATTGTDLRGPLRAGASDADLEEIVRRVWAVRGDRYSELRASATPGLPKVEMSYIGG
jgi:cyclic pyranopterin phosphate synthase